MNRNVELGFGIMRMPVVENDSGNKVVNWSECEKLITEYMKGDYCYFDTHPAYMGEKSEEIIRRFVVKKYPRNRYFIADKMPYYINAHQDYELFLSQSLSNLGVSYIDYYMLHAISQDVYKLHSKYGGFDFLNRKKEEGIIKHIGFSFHGSAELLETILMEHPEFEFVQLQINFFDWENKNIQSKRCYEIAMKYQKDIMVMEPIKGGSLANELSLHNENITSHELARCSLAFVANLPGINVILSGMSEVEHVVLNRETISKCKDGKLIYEKDFYDELKKLINSRNLIECTACGYCARECPSKVKIPNILSLLNNYGNQGKHDLTAIGRYTIFYRSYIKDGYASKCINCGKCETRCPQKVNIRKHLKHAARIFEGEGNNEMYYSAEKNVQILIYLMKQHGVKKIVISPGTQNICFAYSVQQDGDFEIYSAPDERSAAYMACGLAAESGTPVAISCTGATASRNYLPGLTEAYYRNLPVLAITSTQPRERSGSLTPQFIDRSSIQKDVARQSTYIKSIHSYEDELNAETIINEALLELWRDEGGPVHIDLETEGNPDFSVRFLPKVRTIRRIKYTDQLPEIAKDKKIGIFVGSHKKWTEKLQTAVEEFCYKYNAVVLHDHTSNYTGQYGVMASLIFSQDNPDIEMMEFDVLIHIGQVSGAYMDIRPAEVWRVSEDGGIYDTFRKMTYVFDMPEYLFFENYNSDNRLQVNSDSLSKVYQKKYSELLRKIGDIPFSNIWVAWQLSKQMPDNSEIHLGILNSLRSWNFFETNKTILRFSNTGGFGIDGALSTLVGASLTNKDKLYFAIVGDLAFFYDINALGNRHIGSNLRIILISNGCGTEFKNYNHFAARFGGEADDYIAAKGHYGGCSEVLVKNYVQNLGFDYISAKNKTEFQEKMRLFLEPSKSDKSIVFEIFTNPEDESNALQSVRGLNGSGRKVETSGNAIYGSNRLQEKDWQFVLWGTGRCFQKHLSALESKCKISYVCDNNSGKWNKEVREGILCINPEKLKEMENVFVIITVEDVSMTMQIANQLLDLGIDKFDTVFNFIKY